MNVRKSLYVNRASRMSRISRISRISRVERISRKSISDIRQRSSSISRYYSSSSALSTKMFLDQEDSTERSDEARTEKPTHEHVKQQPDVNHTPNLNHKTTQLFTGAKYYGPWNQFSFHGIGTYTFPNGVEYDGHFSNGRFHGSGKLTYPNGTTITGHWNHGFSSNLQLRFADGLAFSEHNWTYCMERDRRFAGEEYGRMLPVGETKQFAKPMDYKVPDGCYNVYDGYYNPRTKCIYSYTEPDRIVRIPTSADEKWIMECCPLSTQIMSSSQQNERDNMEGICLGNVDAYMQEGLWRASRWFSYNSNVY